MEQGPREGGEGPAGGIRWDCIYRLRASAGWRVVKDGLYVCRVTLDRRAASRAEKYMRRSAALGMGRKEAVELALRVGHGRMGGTARHCFLFQLTPALSPAPSYAVPARGSRGLVSLQGGRDNLVPGHADRPFRAGLARYWHERDVASHASPSLGRDRQVQNLASPCVSFPGRSSVSKRGQGGAWGRSGCEVDVAPTNQFAVRSVDGTKEGRQAW